MKVNCIDLCVFNMTFHAFVLCKNNDFLQDVTRLVAMDALFISGSTLSSALNGYQY